MSTREIASYIFEHLDEEQLQGFIALFGKFYPVEKQTDNRKAESFQLLKKMIKSVPDLDEEELATYREEKYGI